MVKCRNVAESQPRRFNVKVSSDAWFNVAVYPLRLQNVVLVKSWSQLCTRNEEENVQEVEDVEGEKRRKKKIKACGQKSSISYMHYKAFNQALH
ncbi:unnamed protein product [Acanthoscelides obtectus]|uniref:Uncharacterized protein n=1 Tax=Acanthoscelides obtectus TaxID=200917 RepID=A0A9P0JTE2_ACAOB|nr:unnamed protein product [Acanthoscelides obtectus]CAK1679155.1 hypothetical protein AOBTE_LOCUS32150 [Acanthoscelides obtectus]